MPVFSGNTSTSAISTALNIVGTIVSWSVANMSGGTNQVNVYIGSGSTVYCIYSENMATGDYFNYLGGEITLLSVDSIYITATASVDYYFTIK